MALGHAELSQNDDQLNKKKKNPPELITKNFSGPFSDGLRTELWKGKCLQGNFKIMLRALWEWLVMITSCAPYEAPWSPYDAVLGELGVEFFDPGTPRPWLIGWQKGGLGSDHRCWKLSHVNLAATIVFWSVTFNYCFRGHLLASLVDHAVTLEHYQFITRAKVSLQNGIVTVLMILISLSDGDLPSS